MSEQSAKEDIQEVEKGHFDPYQLDPSHVLEPPTRMSAILRQIGPGIILSASIVGSGELIATTTLGAKVGYTVMWLIVFSCLIKAVVQAFLGRYTIIMGETGLAAFNRIPGKLGRVNWVLWAWAAMVLITLFQVAAMFIGVSQAMKQLTGVAVIWWILGFFVLTLVLLLGGAYQRIERLAMVKVGLFTLITLLAAIVLTRMPEYFSWGDVWKGFSFELPDAGLGIALATFGITGVGATELYMYTYWCVEKGYARYTGPHEDSEARGRSLLDDHLHRCNDRVLPVGCRHSPRHGASTRQQRDDSGSVQHLHPDTRGLGEMAVLSRCNHRPVRNGVRVDCGPLAHVRGFPARLRRLPA